MSAVWKASRAAVKRRKLQTFVIGVVILISTATIVVALGLLAASQAPFDQAYARQSGAHLTAIYDSTKATDGQLAQTAHQAGVTAAAGPFGQTTLDVAPSDQTESRLTSSVLATVGRADSGGPVDKLNVWAGRWSTGPGEIVLDIGPASRDGAPPLGTRIPIRNGPSLTVVGLAYSVGPVRGRLGQPGADGRAALDLRADALPLRLRVDEC